MLTDSRPVCAGLLRCRAILLPTWRGWLVLLGVVAGLGFVLLRGTLPFLAVHDSKPGGPLVVEGWVPDHAIAETIAEFQREQYTMLLVSGGPIGKGAPFSEHRTFAEFGAAVAVKLGFDPAHLHAVPAPEVRQDRTYTSAVAVRDWLRQRGAMPARINVVSLGAHSRRTRLLYRHAFGDGTEIGIIALPERDFDPRRWWTSSQGVRIVVGELLAYGYARFVFRPGPSATPD